MKGSKHGTSSFTSSNCCSNFIKGALRYLVCYPMCVFAVLCREGKCRACLTWHGSFFKTSKWNVRLIRCMRHAKWRSSYYDGFLLVLNIRYRSVQFGSRDVMSELDTRSRSGAWQYIDEAERPWAFVYFALRAGATPAALMSYVKAHAATFGATFADQLDAYLKGDDGYVIPHFVSRYDYYSSYNYSANCCGTLNVRSVSSVLHAVDACAEEQEQECGKRAIGTRALWRAWSTDCL